MFIHIPVKLSYPLLSLFGGNSFSAFDPSGSRWTHPGQWAAAVQRPGSRGGFRCLAQGHLIHGWARRRVLHSHSPRPYFELLMLNLKEPEWAWLSIMYTRPIHCTRHCSVIVFLQSTHSKIENWICTKLINTSMFTYHILGTEWLMALIDYYL